MKFERKGNIEGKGENAGNQHFLLFSQCFLKASVSMLLQVDSFIIFIQRMVSLTFILLVQNASCSFTYRLYRSIKA